MENPLYLGIDGGGTRTRAVVLDATGRVLGVGQSGGSNWHNLPAAQVQEHLAAATAAAFAAAGLKLRLGAHAYLGMAGVKGARDARAVGALAVAAGLASPGALEVVNDTDNALAGGLSGRPGICVIAGTGSHALGRDAQGRLRTCGGWGWALDDVGSGLFLGIEAVRAAVRSADGRAPAPRLLRLVQEQLGVGDPADLLRRLYVDESDLPGRLAALAPEVLRLAEEDPVAAAILARGAEGLAELVAVIAADLFPQAACEVVLAGGLACSGGSYQALIEARIQARLPAARITPAELSPVLGSALRALQGAGLRVDATRLDTLRRSATAQGL